MHIFKNLMLLFDRLVNKVSEKLSDYLEHTSSDQVLVPDMQIQITLCFFPLGIIDFLTVVTR